MSWGSLRGNTVEDAALVRVTEMWVVVGWGEGPHERFSAFA